MARVSRTLIACLTLSSLFAFGCEKKTDEALEQPSEQAAATPPVAPTQEQVAVAAADGTPTEAVVEQPAQNAPAAEDPAKAAPAPEAQQPAAH